MRSLWAVCGVGLVTLASVAQLRAQNNVAARPDDDRAARDIQVALANPVTVRLDHASMRRAIDAIAAAAHVRVGYQPELIDTVTKKVTLVAAQRPLQEVFDQVLSETSLQLVALSATQLAVIERGTASVKTVQPTTGIIQGTVRDSVHGRGLGGATVRVEGLKISAVTSDSGTFTLHGVPVGQQLLSIRVFGYRPAQRAVTVSAEERAMVRVLLAELPTVLSGVVTTATGQQRKIEVGNDITTLNVDSLRQVAPITSMTDLLESRVPGLTVLRSSGAPGAPARLRLRGPGSVTGNNDPIVIVDGIRVYAAQSDARTANLAGSALSSANYAAPSPIDQIDPNSIETVEVLKGPSASSLYGADAANGVIVVTTKKGRAGPMRWNAYADQGLSYLPGTYPLDVKRWGHIPHDGGIGGANAAANGGVDVNAQCDIGNTDCIGDSVTALQLANLPRWSPFGTGSASGVGLGVSGGASALTYALNGSASSTLGYLRLPGAFRDAFQDYHGYAPPGWTKRPDRYTTWGGGGDLTVQVSPQMRLDFGSTLHHSLQQGSSLDNTFSDLISALDSVGAAYRNAYERVTGEQLTFNNALTAVWSPWTWLPLTGIAGLNISTGHDVALLSRDISINSPGTFPADTLGRYGIGQKNATVRTLGLNTTIPGWHGRLRTAFGFSLNAQNISDLAGHKDTLPLGVDVASTLDRGATPTTTSTATYGWFFEPRLSLSQRFFLTPGFRLDGGNANGSGARVSGLPTKLTFAALFPKVNFSWVALDRQDADAAPFLGVLTLLRPRLALGSAGVEPTPGDRFRLLGGLPSGTGSDPGASNDTLQIRALGNTQLRPERSFEVEGGFDAEAWHGRISTGVTYARKMQHDAIIPVTLAASVDGGGTININVGEVRNVNTEASVSIRAIETSLVTWTVGGNISHNDNMVVRLDQTSAALFQGANGTTTNKEPASEVAISGSKIAVGYPLFGRWEFPILGYGDANGDGMIERDEIRIGDTSVFIGRNDPAVTAALTTNLGLFHGQISIDATLSHQGGYSQLNTLRSYLTGGDLPGATLAQQADYVAAGLGQTGSLPLTSVGLAQTISVWRWQSLSINYMVSSSVRRHLRVPLRSVALQGSNLGLWTNYRGKDPDVNGFPNGNVTIDSGQQAQARTWSFHVTLGN